MRDFGIVKPGTTLNIPYPTYDSNDPTASVTQTGLAVTDIEIYKDGSTTQRVSDSGYTLLDTDGTDFDGITGINGFSVNLSDNTTTGFYASGSQYWVIVSSVTVDSGVVNLLAATFWIGYPDAILNTTIATLASQTSFTLTTGPAEDNALNDMYCIIHDVASAVQFGYALISNYTGATKTVTLAAGTTFTATATDNISVMGLAPLQPTVAGNKADVESTGEIGLNFDNIKDATGAHTLTNITIPVSSTVSDGAKAATALSTSVWTNAKAAFLDIAVSSRSSHTAANVWSVATRALTDKAGFSLAATGLNLITQAQAGVVEIAKAVWDRVITSANHNIQYSGGRVLRSIQERGGYETGAVWIDTVNGTAGTEDYENGTVHFPVNTLADAITIATSISLAKYQIAGGSTITLSQAFTNSVMSGHGWTLALNSQNVSGTHFAEAVVSGICTGATAPHFHHCEMGNCTLPPSYIHDGPLTGTITVGSIGTFDIQNCFAANSVIFDYGAAIGNTTIHIEAWSGDFEVQNLGQSGTDVLDVSGSGDITINANCVGGTINLFGNFTYTNNGSGITINEDANFDGAAEITAIKAKTDNLPDGVQKNVALSNFPFLMVDGTDFATPEIGLTVTCQISKDGGAFAGSTNSVSEIANGVYKINFTQTEMNADTITLKFTAVGAAQNTITILTNS